MKIESVRIENFRSFEDATVPFNNYACLVGPNGAGKSTVLTALNVFFRETENLPTDLSQLEQEDFHCKNTEIPIQDHGHLFATLVTKLKMISPTMFAGTTDRHCRGYL